MSDEQKTILIVEDEKAMLDALSNKFEKEGFQVFKAVNGQEGVDVAFDQKPDLVIMDILMPKLGGLEAAKKIRQDKKWGSDVPILVLTNLNDPESVSEAATYHVYDFLVKTDWGLDDIVQLARDRLFI